MSVGFDIRIDLETHRDLPLATALVIHSIKDENLSVVIIEQEDLDEGPFASAMVSLKDSSRLGPESQCFTKVLAMLSISLTLSKELQ